MALAIRWIKRRYEHSLLSPRRKELELEISNAWGRAIRLIPASTSESYDEIHYAVDQGQRLAVVRVNSPFRKTPEDVAPHCAGFPLQPKQRLNHEWNAYSKLAPHQLSPEPLWRTDDAIACSWLSWPRASRYLVQHRSRFWEVIQRVLPAIRAMHDNGVTHLDMNPGNLMLDPDSNRVAIIDFEFAPSEWITHAQQKGFDYLRLMADCTKRRRGGRQFEANVDRMVNLLDQYVDEESRDADLRFSTTLLQRLNANPELCNQLRRVFRRL